MTPPLAAALSLVSFAAIFGGYFLPTIIALKRHRQAGAVLVLNLFLGWTLIGWVIALAIACSARPYQQQLATIGPRY